MDIKTLIKKLDIGPFGLGWSYFKDGWAGIAKYLCEKLSKLLKKLPAEDLKKYAGIIQMVAELLKTICEKFIKDEKVAKKIGLIIETISGMAKHCEDGEYTTDELDLDIDAIEAVIDSFKDKE